MYASDLAEYLGCTVKTVIDIKHEFHLKTRELVLGRIVETDFSEEDVKFVKDIYTKRENEKKEEERLKAEEKEKAFQNNLEALRAAHPLVTDDRCFRLSWWPETLPSVLDEVDE